MATTATQLAAEAVTKGRATNTHPARCVPARGMASAQREAYASLVARFGEVGPFGAPFPGSAASTPFAAPEIAVAPADPRHSSRGFCHACGDEFCYAEAQS